MDKALINTMFENFKEVYRYEIKCIDREIISCMYNMRVHDIPRLQINREMLVTELQALESCQRHFNLMVI